MTPPAVNIYQNIHDQFTDIKPDGSLGPRLATSWQANDDATVWAFTIRNDEAQGYGYRTTLKGGGWEGANYLL